MKQLGSLISLLFLLAAAANAMEQDTNKITIKLIKSESINPRTLQLIENYIVSTFYVDLADEDESADVVLIPVIEVSAYPNVSAASVKDVFINKKANCLMVRRTPVSISSIDANLEIRDWGTILELQFSLNGDEVINKREFNAAFCELVWEKTKRRCHLLKY